MRERTVVKIQSPKSSWAITGTPSEPTSLFVFRCVRTWQHDPEWMMGGSTLWNKHSNPPGKSNKVQTGRAKLPYNCSVTFSAVEEVIFHGRSPVPRLKGPMLRLLTEQAMFYGGQVNPAALLMRIKGLYCRVLLRKHYQFSQFWIFRLENLNSSVMTS